VRVAGWVAGVGTLCAADNMMGFCCVLRGWLDKNKRKGIGGFKLV